MNPENFQRLTSKSLPKFRDGKAFTGIHLFFSWIVQSVLCIMAASSLPLHRSRGEVYLVNNKALTINSNHTVNYKPRLALPVVRPEAIKRKSFTVNILCTCNLLERTFKCSEKNVVS